jgi:ATP-dependent Clp protease ATP-binding subunit ClpC
VWPEHLLAALVIEGKGVSACALSRLGIDPERIRVELAIRVRPRSEQGPTPHVPLGASTGTALELASEEAREMKRHGIIGTGHVLLGLIRERQGVAANLLQDLGVRFPEARAAVLACERAIDDDPIWDRMG